MIEYSVHTIELTTTITTTYYHQIRQRLSQRKPSIEKANWENEYKGIIKSTYTYRQLELPGINSITLCLIETLDEIPLKSLIYIEVNLYDAFKTTKNNKSVIIDNSHIKEAMHNVLHTLALLLGKEILEDFDLSLNRADFCLNIKFKTQAIAEMYISLLKKSIPTKPLSEVKILDRSQHRKIPYKDSLLLKCKSYSFQIYSKYLQMCKKNLPGKEDAAGIVRFELRASKSKLQQLAKKYDLPSPTANLLGFIENAPTITKNEIPRLVSKISGSGVLCKYSNLKSEIKSSTLKSKDKKIMLNISYYLSKHSSGEHLLETLGLDYKDWKRILKKYDKLGYSPIPIPSRSPINYLPGTLYWPFPDN